MRQRLVQTLQQALKNHPTLKLFGESPPPIPFLLGWIEEESSGRHELIYGKKDDIAYGLFQVHSSELTHIGLKDVDPSEVIKTLDGSIDMGLRMLSWRASRVLRASAQKVLPDFWLYVKLDHAFPVYTRLAITDFAKTKGHYPSRIGEAFEYLHYLRASVSPKMFGRSKGKMRDFARPLLRIQDNVMDVARNWAAYSGGARRRGASRSLVTIITRHPYLRPLSSRYGMRFSNAQKAYRMHWGVDIPGKIGDPIVAAGDGRVILSALRPRSGEAVHVRHTDGVETRYFHLSKRLVNEGDIVRAGDRLGLLGSTGDSVRPHLHFEIHVNGEKVNPEPFLNRLGGDIINILEK